MNSLAENEINIFFKNNSIVSRKILSQSFGMKCEKITLQNEIIFVAKYYVSSNSKFNSIVSETNSLEYLLIKFPNLFPKVKYKSKNLLIIEYIEANNIKDKNYEIKLAKEILKLHKISNDKYGFHFDAQIGGLKQPNKYHSNWIEFFLNNRLNLIFETINKNNLMPIEINKKIEKLMNDLGNRFPKKPNISLLHGDLWSGNILFHNGELCSFIDPGIFFGHNEMEIAYLKWFKYVDTDFTNYYSNEIKIEKNYLDYEPIYQLFYCLLNIHLWERDFYLKDAIRLLNKLV